MKKAIILGLCAALTLSLTACENTPAQSSHSNKEDSQSNIDFVARESTVTFMKTF